jgi:ornithine cyclodeaminase
MKANQFHEDDIYEELGHIVAGKKPARENDEEITVFESVGLAVADIVVAKRVYEKVLAAGGGQKVSL